MAYQVTARKWRPQRFDEVVGQQHITTTLTNALHTGRVAQCYLFCGPRGVGKTTTARILAKALNCGNRGAGADPCGECATCKAITEGTSMDVLEIDGASNNSVDDVRELREIVRYIPTEGSYKIYIIDEVHMLSTPAFNALLKTLEEPPERVVFIFATTEAQAVPETILSRCQRFNFRPIPTTQIAGHLGKITGEEGITADEEALYLLARRADGALRDAESLLDQVVSFSDQLTTESVREVLGLVDRSVFFDAAQAIADSDGARLLDLVGAIIDEGGDVEEFVRGFIEHASHMLFTKVQGSAAKLEVADTERTRFEEGVGSFAEEDLLRIVQALMELDGDLRRSVQPRFRTELVLVRLAHMGRAVDVGRLLNRLAALEAAVAGRPTPRSAPAAAPAPSAAAAPAPQAPRPTPAPRTAAAPPDRATEGPPARAVEGPPASAAEGPPPPVPPPTDEGPAASPPPPTAPSGDADLSVLRDQWPRVTHIVRESQPSAGNFLEQVVRMDLEGSVLTLFFAPENRFGMGLVGKAGDAVAAAIADVTGYQLRVRCSLDNDGSGGRGGGGQPRPPAAPPAHGGPSPAPVPTTGDPGPAAAGDDVDPTVRAVLDAFDGELV